MAYGNYVEVDKRFSKMKREIYDCSSDDSFFKNIKNNNKIEFNGQRLNGIISYEKGFFIRSIYCLWRNLKITKEEGIIELGRYFKKSKDGDKIMKEIMREGFGMNKLTGQSLAKWFISVVGQDYFIKTIYGKLEENNLRDYDDAVSEIGRGIAGDEDLYISFTAKSVNAGVKYSNLSKPMLNRKLVNNLRKLVGSKNRNSLTISIDTQSRFQVNFIIISY